MDKLEILEHRYGQDYHDYFEDLATLLFCIKYNQKEGVIRRKNQAGIEADPIDYKGKRIAYQAKYYDKGTKLSERKVDFIKSVNEAAREGVKKLVIYTNKELTQSAKDNQDRSKPREKPAFEQEITELAKQNDMEIEWITGDRINTILQMPENNYIREHFFGKDDKGSDYTKFYRYAIDKMAIHDAESIYGDISLEDGYLQPHIVFDGTQTNLKKFLFNWVEGKYDKKTISDRVMLLYGEPGHGKTSLCYKAMYDFRKQSWLSGIVSNIFCFSLNPAFTELKCGDDLIIRKLLCWGDSRDNVIQPGDCNNALIFFDGFDELQDSRQNLMISDFINERVFPFAADNNARVVITTRRMSIERELDRNKRVRGVEKVMAFEIQPLSFEQQSEWISKYADRCAKISQQEEHSSINWLEKAQALYGYMDTFSKYIKGGLSDRSVSEIFSIPFIFRMVVECQYDPNEYKSTVKLYEDLFDETWKRRQKRLDGGNPKNNKEDTISMIAEHAMKCYEEDADSALVDVSINSSCFLWTYQFYTKHTIDADINNLDEQEEDQQLRIGFLHRSFYEYFLAKRIMLELLKRIYDDVSIKGLKQFLARLTRKRINQDTLKYIKELYELLSSSKQKAVNNSLRSVYKIIRNTDAILQETNEMGWINTGSELRTVSPLNAGNTLLWNVVSISTNCSLYFNKQYCSLYPLVNYALDYINLSNADLSDVNISYAKLNGADLKSILLKNTIIKGAQLEYAQLEEATLEGARLEGANLKEASLKKAILKGAHLERAYLGEANATEAIADGSHFENANLRKTIMKGIHLKVAHLERANLKETILTDAHLEQVHLEGAQLDDVNFKGCILEKAHLDRAYLKSIDLNGANLEKTSFKGAHLCIVDLGQANLKEAHLEGTRFEQVNLKNAYLNGAHLKKAHLEGAHLEGAHLEDAILEAVHLEKAILKNACLEHAHLEQAQLEGTNLIGANLEDANLKRANLKMANLKMANLSRANLEQVDLEGARLTKQHLKQADFRKSKLEGAILDGNRLEGTRLIKVRNQFYDYWKNINAK